MQKRVVETIDQRRWTTRMDRKLVNGSWGLAPDTASTEHDLDGWANHAPTCRYIRPDCAHESNQEPVCTDCLFLYEQNCQAPDELNFLRHCRAIRQYIDQGSSYFFSQYVAAFLVGPTGRILDIDERSTAFLHSSGTLAIRHNCIWASDSEFNAVLSGAIERASVTGEPETLVCQGSAATQTRYTVLLQPKQGSAKERLAHPHHVSCLVFPLGRRRIASARQIMSMFALSPAEARLARALCHGETLEEYASAQGVKLTTVKTQLRAVFAKTQTDRQVTLVGLITGIPPLR